MAFRKSSLVLLLLVALLATLVIGGSAAVSRDEARQRAEPQDFSIQNRGTSRIERFDISPRLDSMPPAELDVHAGMEIFDDFRTGSEGPLGPQDEDPIVQDFLGPLAIPTPLVSFDGPSNSSGVSPPDPVGDVGPNHYVAMSNLSFAIYDKTGALLYGPVPNNTLWAGFGGACQTQNSGDPVVLYDQLEDRWLLTQFTSSGTPYYNCVALSQTGDPTGSYYRWAVDTGANFPDYPKYGVWSDAYYISTREFGTINGIGAYAMNKAQMLAGNPSPTIISFFVPINVTPYLGGDGLLPADIDGFVPPASSNPQYFAGTQDDGGGYGAPQDAVQIWEFNVDWVTPGNSTFALANTLPIASFDTQFSGCVGRSCIPQPATTNKLDILSYRQRPIFRLAYRNFGTHESLVTNQSVEASAGIAGTRWWEIRDPGGTPFIYQEGTYAPGTSDGIHRWMGSIAMDGSGNIALGYSASDGTSTYPSIWYTGRLAGDLPLGQMTLGEASIVNGTGSQTGSQRWGDYSSMNIDPVDDCTFWYVNEYVPTTSSTGWRLRIGAFKFEECGSPGFTLAGSPEAQSVCIPDDAQYSIDVQGFLGFAAPVTMSALGNPAGTTAGFSVNPVSPGGSTQLTIGNTGAATAGSYAIGVVGTTVTKTITTTVGLDLFDSVPASITLVSPADEDTGVSQKPTFSWGAAAGATGYAIEVATDPGFTNVVYSAGVSGTSHLMSEILDPYSRYYWRVSGANPCGSGTVSAAFSFMTAGTGSLLLVDDDDNVPDTRSSYTAILDGLGMEYDVWDTGNSDNEPGIGDLLQYDAVIWFSGDEFGGAAGPGSAGETALAGWLDAGGCLFLSSQDYRYDRGGLTSFMTGYLGVSDIFNDSGDYVSVTGINVFSSLGPYSLTYPPLSDWSDPIITGNGGLDAMIGNNANVAAVTKDAGSYKTSFWAFPWETMPAAGRTATMQAFLDWCGIGSGSSSGVISGNVLLQGRQAHGDTLVTAWQAGAPVMTDTTNTDGNFFSLMLPAGVYSLTLEQGSYLQAITDTVTVVSGSVTNLGSELLLGGDVNGDDTVDILDLAAIGSKFGLTESDPGYDPLMDINADGVINIQDLALAAGNYGKSPSW